MARAYSEDLRERVVSAVISGKSCLEAAEQFAVSHSSAIKWIHQKREAGAVATPPMGGPKPRLLVDYRDWLLSRMAAKPDLTVQALLDELRQQHGVQVCLDTLWRFLKAQGLSFKKNRSRIRTGQA
jgi:transposase